MSLVLNGSGTIAGLTSGGLPDATITQAEIGTNVAGTGPAFSAYPSGNQSLSSSTFTKIQFNTEEFDTNSNFDSTTNYRFTPTVAGYYQVNLTVAANASVGTQATIYKNGSVFQYGSYNGNSVWSIASVLMYLNGSTDYIEGYLYAAGAATSQGGANLQRFSASLVRAA